MVLENSGQGRDIFPILQVLSEPDASTVMEIYDAY